MRECPVAGESLQPQDITLSEEIEQPFAGGRLRQQLHLPLLNDPDELRFGIALAEDVFLGFMEFHSAAAREIEQVLFRKGVKGGVALQEVGHALSNDGGFHESEIADDTSTGIARRLGAGAARLSSMIHQSGFRAGDNGSMNDQLTIAGRTFRSRLMIGTGKYRSFQEMVRCHEASGAEVVTLAVRRVNLTDKTKESMLDFIDRSKYFILPNTAGCYNAEDAIRTARLAREVGLSNWIKLEVLGDEKTLLPDNEGLLEATKVLAKEGFVVLPYTNDDLISARKLIDAGAAAVMPLAAPIGSGLGIQNFATMRILREQITAVPLIVDAGVGTASDACIAMELGFEGLLLNTAVAAAEDSEKMAAAMRHAVEAGRLAFQAGRMGRKLYASASSPIEGVIASART